MKITLKNMINDQTFHLSLALNEGSHSKFLILNGHLVFVVKKQQSY